MTSVSYMKFSDYSKLTVEWNIPKPIEIFSTTDGIIMNHVNAKGFQFKIQPSTDRSSIKIYYLYPLTTFLSLELRDTFFYTCGSTTTYEKTVLKKIECFHANEPDKWHYIASLTKSDVWFHNALEDGSLLINFIIEIYRKNMCTEPVIPESELCRDLEKMFLDGPFSDVVIKSVDGKEFKVHKNMLACRCVVLKALFEHTFIESQSDIIESPWASDVLMEVINFIYTDRANVKNNPKELLAAAEYYQLMRLKSTCENELIRNLSNENVIETLQLADLHSANSLKEYSLKFIETNGLAKIMKTDGWGNLESNLSKTICEYLHK